jgi:hypothetical protein
MLTTTTHDLFYILPSMKLPAGDVGRHRESNSGNAEVLGIGCLEDFVQDTEAGAFEEQDVSLGIEVASAVLAGLGGIIQKYMLVLRNKLLAGLFADMENRRWDPGTTSNTICVVLTTTTNDSTAITFSSNVRSCPLLCLG